MISHLCSHGPEGEKSWSTLSLLKVLLFGLVLYSVNVGLQISIGAYYLGMRECYRGITMEYDNFTLAKALGQNPEKFMTTTPAPIAVSLSCNSP